MPKTIVLSLGGSLIFPDNLDRNFLINFGKTISRYIKKNYNFAIICGGGKLARSMQESASRAKKMGNEELDWIGIYATKINAHLLKSVFRDSADDLIISDPTEKINFKKSIVIASGWKPGWSTDYDAVLLAKNLGTREIVNMSNVDFVYDKDPKKHADAKKIEKMGWHDYAALVSGKWKAGMNAPFDPVAAKEAEKSKMKVNIVGRDMKNLGNLLDGKKFKGTVIG